MARLLVCQCHTTLRSVPGSTTIGSDAVTATIATGPVTITITRWKFLVLLVMTFDTAMTMAPSLATTTIKMAMIASLVTENGHTPNYRK